MPFSTDPSYAQSLDENDPLAGFRTRFVVDDPNLIYLDGNSLGRLPRDTAARSQHLLEHGWGRRLIRGWNDGWIEINERIGDKIAQLLGASPGEVAISDSTSTNLYKLALAALRARPGRTKIVTDDLNFPSDVYIFQGLARDSHQVELVPSPDGIHGPVEGLLAAMDEDTALVSLSHTVFKSAYTYDMAAITAHAHKVGALTLWDLSHSAGSVIVELNKANADLAVGCTYKYLNGGPGAPAFLYVRKDLQDELTNPISGWFGQKNAFAFGLNYEPTSGIRRFLTGTPPILSIAPIETGVDILLEAGMARLREKSVRQTEYLIELWRELLAPLGFTMNSPADPAWRGSHVSLGHPDAWRIDQALIEEMHVLPDFRKPNNIRLGITPLYTTFAEIHEAVMRMKRVVEEKLYEKYDAGAGGVT
ncbi:MAG TPA: kynureninase [Anaerolineales bacterium]|nr:kynureninase [Anaerolineales bacterium]